MILLPFEDVKALLAPYEGSETISPSEVLRLQLQLTELLTDHFVDVPTLKFLLRFLTPQSYDDIVEERNVEHVCGYATCGQLPRNTSRRASDLAQVTKYQIYNRKPLMILPNTYLLQYCCKEHYQALLFYANQLSSEAVFARKYITAVPPFPNNLPATWFENGITSLEEVLAKHRQYKDQGKLLSDIITMMNGLLVADLATGEQETSGLVRLLQDFDLVENEVEPPSVDFNRLEDEEGAVTASKGIDGYLTTDRSYGGYVV